MKQRRRLIPPQTLQLLLDKSREGVPIVRLMRDYGLTNTLARPAFIRLLARYALHPDNPSFSPPWLDMTNPLPQSQPKDWSYKGTFPTGEWVQNK